LPGLGVLDMAENACPLLHNFIPLRGALARDPRIWSHYLAEAIELFGDSSEVLIGQHHWPYHAGGRGDRDGADASRARSAAVGTPGSAGSRALAVTRQPGRRHRQNVSRMVSASGVGWMPSKMPNTAILCILVEAGSGIEPL
jgi:hypothetical protein